MNQGINDNVLRRLNLDDEENKKQRIKSILKKNNIEKLSEQNTLIDKIFYLIYDKNKKNIVDIEKILKILQNNSFEKLESILYKIIKFVKSFELSDEDLKEIASQIKNSSEYEKEKRFMNFIAFIGNEQIKSKELMNIIKEKVENINEYKDIIYYWEKKLIFSFVYSKEKPKNIKFVENIIKKLIIQDYNLSICKGILEYFNIFLFDANFNQYEIIDSMIDMIISYRIQDIEKTFELEKDRNGNPPMIDNNLLIDFYLAITNPKNKDNINDNVDVDENDYFFNRKSGDRTKDELLKNFNIINKLPDKALIDMESQIEYVQESIKIFSEKLSKYPIKKHIFQNWAKRTDFTKGIDKKFSAEIIGIISCAIKDCFKNYLRYSQIIAILSFINKEKKYGLIEQISTGEGKSHIICCLSIFYGLQEKNVDIITSGMTLAQRDAEKYKNIYDYFGLTASYPQHYSSIPYKSKILYGTFLEFEGDYLYDLTSQENIRNDRTHDVIIIDEIDNLLIDNLLGRIELTHASKGYNFLFPFYLIFFEYIEIFDFIFMMRCNMLMQSLDEEKKDKFIKELIDPEKRKNTLVNFIKKNTEEMLKNKNVNINDVITDDVQREINNKKKHFENFYHHPKFLEGFLNFQSQKWIDTAYDSKNLYRNNREYITTSEDYQGKKIVQPIDYKNTGEIQKNTIFQNGLHQMLQIKHKLRFHPERLSHTFLSYISYFHKFKKTDEFLFFGLTGTIGDESTQEIYKSPHIDSRILFIPEHRRKRFIELPPLIAKNNNEHIDKICNDIILNYSKGRKILVICETIQEAVELEKELKHNDNFKNDDNIGMFIKNDKIDDGFKTKQIIISTNLGGRGQDFETSEIEENVGGMHVIITKLSKNIRVQNQAFGRTARKGKKGTGIIIFKNSKYNSYEEIKAHRNENEINSLNKKLKYLKLLLFRDNLFENFSKFIKKSHIDFNSYLYNDITERWGYFLIENVAIYNYDNFDENKINKAYTKFENELEDIILNKEKAYDKFFNPFWKILEGNKILHSDELDCMNYFKFEDEEDYFYFASSYFKPIAVLKDKSISIMKSKGDAMVEYLLKAKDKVNKLIDNFLKPIYIFLEDRDTLLKHCNENFENENLEIFFDYANEFFLQKYNESELFEQINNRIKILLKFQNNIDENINIIKDFNLNYSQDLNYYLFITFKPIEDLILTEEEKNEIKFLEDSGLNEIYSLSIKRRIDFARTNFILNIFLVIFNYTGLNDLFVKAKIFINNIKLIYVNRGHINNLHLDGIFYTIFARIIRLFNNQNIERNIVIEDIRNPDPIYNIEVKKDNLKEKFMKEIKNFGNDIYLKTLEKTKYLNFLLFVDFYLKNNNWRNEIKKILEKNFNIYFSNKDIIININEKNFNEILLKAKSCLKQFLNSFASTINELTMETEYDKDKINSLEYLIKRLNPLEMTKQIYTETMKEILKQGIINGEGFLKLKLFSKKKENNYSIFRFKYTTQYPDNINPINSINDFNIDQSQQICYIDNTFEDLEYFYRLVGYRNIKSLLIKDFCVRIKELLIDIYNNAILLKEDDFDSFNKELKLYYLNMISNYFDEKIYSKNSSAPFETCIKNNLSEEEQNEYNSLLLKAFEDANKQINNSELLNIFNNFNN